MLNWRNWSSFRLSITVGFVSWIALGYAWAKSAPDSAVGLTIGSFFKPIMHASYRLAASVFPGSYDPHSTGSYLLPLFGSLGNFVVLTVFWYVCVRIARALRPEWASLAQSPVVDKDDEARGDLDSEDEPVYIPPAKTYATKFGSTIDYERFKLRTYREFRKRTGHWPLLSIAFHYLSLVGMCVNAFMFFKVRDVNDWSASKSWLVGGVLAIAWCGLFVGGQKLMWRLDWRQSGRHENGSQPEGRHLF